tara:strand:- start:85 stop:387 length:303 start_codon:yes stop_codon:yes gene_type:complete
LRPTRHSGGQPEISADQALRCSPLSWAERLKRVFDRDISFCPLCGDTLRVIAEVTDPDTIQTILAHLRQRAPAGAVHRKKPEQRPEQGPQKGSLCRYMMV